MGLSNFSKWQAYTNGLCSPDNYINWGFYGMIAAALQRRVWVSDNKPIYPNMYIILVGDPAVGKGLVIKTVSEIIKSYKLILPGEAPSNNGNLSAAEIEFQKVIAEADYKLAQQEEAHYNNVKDKQAQTFEKPLLIPVAADATTYEALVKAMSRSLRRKNFKEYSEEVKRDIAQIYTHSSMCFLLEEIASLFRKRTEDTVNFLLQAYDCGDYTYDTKTQGKDRIRKCCLNILGGTTPDFMQDTFDDKLIGQGFSSRTNYIFATKNRKNVGLIPSLTPEEKQYEKDIVSYVRTLVDVYGEVKMDNGVKTRFQDWWDKECNNPRNNTSLKLLPYYGRKNINTIKLALAHHFGESPDMILTWDDIDFAIETLRIEERTMHYALALESDNPLAAPSKKVKDFLRVQGEQTFESLEIEFWGRVNRSGLEEILNHLIGTSQVSTETKECKLRRTNVMYYSLKK